MSRLWVLFKAMSELFIIITENREQAWASRPWFVQYWVRMFFSLMRINLVLLFIIVLVNSWAKEKKHTFRCAFDKRKFLSLSLQSCWQLKLYTCYFCCVIRVQLMLSIYANLQIYFVCKSIWPKCLMVLTLLWILWEISFWDLTSLLSCNLWWSHDCSI